MRTCPLFLEWPDVSVFSTDPRIQPTRRTPKKSASALCERIQSQQSLCLRQLGANRAGEVRFGRLLKNPRVPAQGLAEGCYQGLSEIQAAHVLLLQDSSTFTLSKYSSKHADFGRTSAGQERTGVSPTPHPGGGCRAGRPLWTGPPALVDSLHSATQPEGRPD